MHKEPEQWENGIIYQGANEPLTLQHNTQNISQMLFHKSVPISQRKKIGQGFEHITFKIPLEDIPRLSQTKNDND